MKAARDIFFVDLSGTTDNRRVMRPISRWLVGAGAVLRRLFGQDGPRVLVFAPAADGKSIDWPDAAELVFTDELLDADTVVRINEWVDHLATLMVEDAELWPTVNGIGLGQLNLYQVQDFLMNYGQAAESLRRLIDQTPGGRCIVVSGYPATARAIRRDMAGRSARIRLRTLPAFRPPFLHRNGASADAPEIDAVTGLDPRVLIVSESTPMAGLFSAVEKCLDDAGIGPNLRLQYDGSAAGFERLPGTSVLHLTRPEDLTGSQSFDVDDQTVKARLRLLATHNGPYGPPLALLHHSLAGRVVPQQVRHLDTVRRILDRARPDLIVVGNDRWWVGMAFVLVAREAGIPTLAVQDGVAWSTPMWSRWNADYAAVNGTQLEGFLLDAGFPAERITIVGQPRYDTFNATAAAAVRDTARHEIGLEPDTFAVLFATQPNQDALYVQRVAEAILAVPDVHLLLRPHPSTSQRALQRLEEMATADRVTSVSSGAIFNLIAAADLVVVQNSTVALEAALLDRPVISANFTGLPGVVSYAACGICAEARDPEGVTQLVTRGRDGGLSTAATDERAQAGIHYLIGPTDGHSAQRVSDLIGELLVTTAAPASAPAPQTHPTDGSRDRLDA